MAMTKEEQAEHLKKCRELSAAKRKEDKAKALGYEDANHTTRILDEDDPLQRVEAISSKLDKLIEVMTEIRDKLPNKMNTDFLK